MESCQYSIVLAVYIVCIYAVSNMLSHVFFFDQSQARAELLDVIAWYLLPLCQPVFSFEFWSHAMRRLQCSVAVYYVSSHRFVDHPLIIPRRDWKSVSASHNSIQLWLHVSQVLAAAAEGFLFCDLWKLGHLLPMVFTSAAKPAAATGHWSLVIANPTP